MEYISGKTFDTPVKAVLLDFDGTISTLRYGWEGVMRPLMLECIAGDAPYSPELEREVDAYIDESTGIQTIQQMKWLAARVHKGGANPNAPTDPWWYKAEYNRRLMETVSGRVESVRSGEVSPDEYLMAGSVEFLKALTQRGVKLYVASGTDDPDVKREAEALGVSGFFALIAGSPVGVEGCSKEQVIARLISDEGLSGADFAVIGDGKVEIRLGREAGARTIGLASDEANRRGINGVKRNRLVSAGADAICGDFLELGELLGFLGLN